MNRSNSIIEPQNKLNLSISEAAAYSGIGMHTLRRLIEQEDCDFVLHVGRNFWIDTKHHEIAAEQDNF